MLKEERYDNILKILENEKYISAAELSEKLFVSLPTIRRDLSELQSRNLIVRSHGGAKKIESSHMVSPIDFRKTLNNVQKTKLCRAAAELIKDNDIIFIDASTTSMQIAEMISGKKSVTVVTNSIPVSVLTQKNGAETLCTGGEMQQNSMCYAGRFAEEFIRNFNFDIMFFSSYGVSRNGFITDTSMEETSLRKAVMNQSEKKVFMCDSTKFCLSAPYNLIRIEQADVIITDAESDIGLLSEIDRNKIIYV